ncbi:hypothetical protein WJX79_003989 [Trebouxia sp. C0005]
MANSCATGCSKNVCQYVHFQVSGTGLRVGKRSCTAAHLLRHGDCVGPDCVPGHTACQNELSTPRARRIPLCKVGIDRCLPYG